MGRWPAFGEQRPEMIQVIMDRTLQAEDIPTNFPGHQE